MRVGIRGNQDTHGKSAGQTGTRQLPADRLLQIGKDAAAQSLTPAATMSLCCHWHTCDSPCSGNCSWHTTLQSMKGPDKNQEHPVLGPPQRWPLAQEPHNNAQHLGVGLPSVPLPYLTEPVLEPVLQRTSSIPHPQSLVSTCIC